MWSFLKNLLVAPEPAISAQEAIRIATAECERRGFPTDEPEALRENRAWVVLAEPGMRGTPRITIDDTTGEVTSFAYLPR